jgi:hypothetical protein
LPGYLLRVVVVMRSGSLLLCVIALGGRSLGAQVSADSTITFVPRDSAMQAAAHTGAVADTGAVVVDSTASVSAVSTGPRPAVVVNVPPPVDTVVARACTSSSAGAIAPNLVGVVFRADAGDSARTAAAREVGGTLVPGGEERQAYVRLPEAGVPVKVAASKLIRVGAVSGVSEVPCPG